MRRNYTGCAVCDSTWGDHWEVIEGERTFFCCSVCAAQFRGLVARIRRETGWECVEAIEIAGDRRGRRVTASCDATSLTVDVAFNADGDLLRFARVPAG